METMVTTSRDGAVRRRGRRGQRVIAAAVTVLLAPLVLAAPADADGGHGADPAKIVVEWNEDGTAAPGDERVGTSVLKRRPDGLHARAHVRGLEPGGVYTFWWVVVQDDGDFPDDIHVQRGASVVVGDNGHARVTMRAQTGDPGILGFPPLGGALLADLTDPLGSTVRVEIAYHGQVEDAGADLDQWQSDFWTGAACPPETPNPNPMQPHCPVYYASTHTP
jgi:hypothetical protein